MEIHEYANRRILITTTEGTPFRIHLPRMYMPFGISGFVPESGPTKYNIDFAIKGYDEEGSEMKTFYETLRTIESKIIDGVTAQSEMIFGHAMTRDELEPMFFSNIKDSTDREPKFRVKVDTTMDDRIKAAVFDKDKVRKQDTIVNKLYAQNSGQAIAELMSVYFMNRKFGCTWKLHQLVVHEPQHLKGFQFII